jgi:hypothetical protein
VGLVGCGGGKSGPQLAQAKGKVIYKSNPVAGASVTFASEQGELAAGITNEQGEFTLSTGGRPGAMLGTHKVYVSKAASAPGMPQDAKNLKAEDMMKMQKAAMGQAKPPAPPKSEIPTKYADPRTSPLPPATVSSDASKNVFEFTLVD